MHKVVSQILVIKVVAEEDEHLGGADVDPAIDQIVTELDDRVLEEQDRVNLQLFGMRVVVVQELAALLVDGDDRRVLARS
eukprot:CAMPEP_0184363028 /NCGR_PEP_ID=MMETSP1089-20130417/137706_1 /TAXON_ID=38269 ORGANISM="Gloeochaete wittrockiana, Strain SAG46.84" /NCGR_SAMPLE_ID=MMETSP1089 /ASSEMBLY_ACC=CAM_ASM_000445 /LENGTH=79 /DNA_ID=CAMNT_0026703355 /DNA_START=63 /DNA_END=302 /DNA_ORIENTATION=-